MSHSAGCPAGAQRWHHGAMVHDAFNLKRFVDAQEPVFAEVLIELERGHKIYR